MVHMPVMLVLKSPVAQRIRKSKQIIFSWFWVGAMIDLCGLILCVLAYPEFMKKVAKHVVFCVVQQPFARLRKRASLTPSTFSDFQTKKKRVRKQQKIIWLYVSRNLTPPPFARSWLINVHLRITYSDKYVQTHFLHTSHSVPPFMVELLPMRRKHETINRSNSVPDPVYLDNCS